LGKACRSAVRGFEEPFSAFGRKKLHQKLEKVLAQKSLPLHFV